MLHAAGATDCRSATGDVIKNPRSVAGVKRGLLSFQGLIGPNCGPDRAFARFRLPDF